MGSEAFRPSASRSALTSRERERETQQHSESVANHQVLGTEVKHANMHWRLPANPQDAEPPHEPTVPRLLPPLAAPPLQAITLFLVQDAASLQAEQESHDPSTPPPPTPPTLPSHTLFFNTETFSKWSQQMSAKTTKKKKQQQTGDRSC